MPSTFSPASTEATDQGRRRTGAIFALAFATAGLAIWGWGSARSTAAATHVVLVENMKFSPAELTLQLGDRIVFKNGDLFPHTATAKGAEPFDSGILPSGKEWSFSPARPGIIHYACTFHPTMEGSLVVRGR